MKALKKINCIIFYLFFMLMPAFTLSVTMTSCEKLFELIGGEEDDEDEDLDEMQMTIDGKEPYFKSLSEEVRIPQYMKDDYEKWSIEYESNLAQPCSFLIDSYMKYTSEKYEEGKVPYCIFKEMNYYASDLNRAEFDFYPNSMPIEARDTIWVVNPFDYESVLAKIPVVQEAGEWVKAVDYTATTNGVTLKLESSDNAVAFGILILEEKVSVNVFYYDAPRHDYDMFYRDERFTLKDGNDNTCTIDWLEPGKKYYIYLAAIDMYDRFTGITDFEVQTAPEK